MVQGALGGRSEVDYARCVLLLFCPWTTHPDDASAAVPYLGDLCKFGKTDWRRALRRRLILRGFPTEEVKSFALNFCFVYCLPRELRVDWDAFREAKAPSAACEKCKEAKTLDYFSDRQWERVRSNRSAICLACAPGKAAEAEAAV